MSQLKLAQLRRAGTISQEFIDLLHEVVPDKMPSGRESHDEIQQNIGKVSVIRLIEKWKWMLDNPEEAKREQVSSAFEEN